MVFGISLTIELDLPYLNWQFPRLLIARAGSSYPRTLSSPTCATSFEIHHLPFSRSQKSKWSSLSSSYGASHSLWTHLLVMYALFPTGAGRLQHFPCSKDARSPFSSSSNSLLWNMIALSFRASSSLFSALNWASFPLVHCQSLFFLLGDLIAHIFLINVCSSSIGMDSSSTSNSGLRFSAVITGCLKVWVNMGISEFGRAITITWQISHGLCFHKGLFVLSTNGVKC